MNSPDGAEILLPESTDSVAAPEKWRRLGPPPCAPPSASQPYPVMSEDPLLQGLAKAEAGKAPSPFGHIEIVIPGAPVSIQATKQVRDAYLARIKQELTRYHFLLTGQLILEVTSLLSGSLSRERL